MSIAPGRLGVLQAAAWASLTLLCLGLVLHTTLVSEDTPFLTRGDGPAWITAPLPQTTNLIGVDPSDPPVFRFVKRFDADPAGGDARLEGRATSDVRLWLNGTPLALDAPQGSWRAPFRARLPAEQLRASNELRVELSPVRGPPLLELQLGPAAARIETDASWRVALVRGAVARPMVRAVVATDAVAHPPARRMPTPGQVLRDRALPVGLIFFLCAGAAYMLPRRLDERQHEEMPRRVAIALALFWLLLFVTKLSALPVALGFDAAAHLHQIDAIAHEGRVPPPSEGFSSYHPPVFHLLTGVLVGATGVDAGSAAGRVVYRLIPFLSGLVSMLFALGVARRLWPADPIRQSLAAIAAGLLPVNVYMSAYVSNEPLHAAFVGLALWLTSEVLLGEGEERQARRRLIALGATLGLALLTKFTSLALAPVIAFFASLRGSWVEDRGPARSVIVFASLMGGAAAISGWFYLRNWILYGDAVVWNLDVPGAATWWMQPGFHTADYYTRFGEALRYPFFSGFSSFWDGVYSTLWGDGLVAGMIDLGTRHGQWRYDYMTLVYWLALPATALMGLGFYRMVRASFEGSDTARRLVYSLLTSVLFLLSFSLFLISIRLPFYAQSRAPYVLAATVPLAIVLCEGLARVPEWLGGARRPIVVALYWGWVGTLFSVIAISFIG
jgi:hypothetical protein